MKHAMRGIDASAELNVGEPFVALRVGKVFSRETGKELPGNVKSVEELHEMVTYFERVQKPTRQWPVIDIEHKTAPGLKLLPAHTSERVPLGGVVDMRVEGDGLMVTPAWTDDGKALKDKAQGLWHVSAVYRTGDCFDPATGERVSGGYFQGFGLTTTPATRPDQLGSVRSEQPDDSPAAKPAPNKEVRAMTRDETLAAYRALSEEDQAAFMKAVMPEPEPDARAEEMDDLEERAQRAEAEAATARNASVDLLSKLNDALKRVEKLEQADHIAQRTAAVKGIAPNLRSVAEAIFDAQGAEAVKTMFADHMVRTDVIGKDGQPKADSVPTDEAGLVAYVRSNLNEGESFVDGLARIRAASPDKYRAAVSRQGVTHA